MNVARGLVISVVLLIVVAGVAGAATVQPHSAAELAAAITAKGLDCKDFMADNGSASASTPSEGTCTVGHEFGVTLDVFPTHANLTTALRKASKGVCAELRKAHSSQKVVFVVGSNWLATFESKVNARPLASSLKAKVQALSC